MPNLIDRAERFQFLTEELQAKGDTQSNIGTDILRMLWEIYKDGLYQTEEYIYETVDRELISQRFESFVEFCDEVVRSHFDPADYFDKFKWVVERVFRYIHIRMQDDDPIIIPFTETPLTVELILDTKGWISKLIILSNKIEMCTSDEQIEKLFFAAIDGTVEDVVQAGNDVQDDRIEIQIDYVERPVQDNRFTLIFDSIDEEQYAVIRKKMGKIIKRHMD